MKETTYLKPMRIAELEFNRLKRWYFATLFSYDGTQQSIRDEYRGVRDENGEAPAREKFYHIPKTIDSLDADYKGDSPEFFIIQHDIRDCISKFKNKNYKAYLDQMILIKLVTMIEIMLSDMLVNSFYLKKEMFYHSELVSFTVQDFLSKDKETLEEEYIEKLFDSAKRSGFKGVSKTYATKLKIRLTEFSEEEVFLGESSKYKYKDIIKMHDERHLIIHRSGYVDDKYKREYGVTRKRIEFDEKEILVYLRTVEKFMIYLRKEFKQHFDRVG